MKHYRWVLAIDVLGTDGKYHYTWLTPVLTIAFYTGIGIGIYEFFQWLGGQL